MGDVPQLVDDSSHEDDPEARPSPRWFVSSCEKQPRSSISPLLSVAWAQVEVTAEELAFDIATQLSAMLHINETPVDDPPQEIKTKARCSSRAPPAIAHNTAHHCRCVAMHSKHILVVTTPVRRRAGSDGEAADDNLLIFEDFCHPSTATVRALVWLVLMYGCVVGRRLMLVVDPRYLADNPPPASGDAAADKREREAWDAFQDIRDAVKRLLAASEGKLGPHKVLVFITNCANLINSYKQLKRQGNAVDAVHAHADLNPLTYGRKRVSKFWRRIFRCMLALHTPDTIRPFFVTPSTAARKAGIVAERRQESGALFVFNPEQAQFNPDGNTILHGVGPTLNAKRALMVRALNISSQQSC